MKRPAYATKQNLLYFITTLLILIPKGPLLGADSTVQVSALMVKIPSDKLDLLGAKIALQLNATKPLTAPPLLLPDEMKRIQAQLALPGTQAKVLSNSSILVEDGRQAEITSGRDPLYFIVPAQDGLYQLEATTGPGVTLKARPTLRGNRIEIFLELARSELLKRAPVPDAPGLQAGIPQMSSYTLSATMTLPDGATCLLAGARGEDTSMLCFATVQLKGAL